MLASFVSAQVNGAYVGDCINWEGKPTDVYLSPKIEYQRNYSKTELTIKGDSVFMYETCYTIFFYPDTTYTSLYPRSDPRCYYYKFTGACKRNKDSLTINLNCLYGSYLNVLQPCARNPEGVTFSEKSDFTRTYHAKITPQGLYIKPDGYFTKPCLLEKMK